MHLFSYFFSPSPFLLPLFPSSPLPPLPLSTSLISPLSFLSHLTENALREGFPSHAPVVMYQLRKEYPGSLGKPPHVAVHSVSLAIQRNECFGLLGPNGITAHSHSSSIVASFPFLFHCGLIPIPLPLWSRSHSSSIVVSFPFCHGPSPIPLHSHSQCYNFGGIFVILLSSCLRCWQDYADLGADGTVRANTGESQDCWL